MNNSPEVLTIAKLTREGGVNVQTVRYYERRGLIPKPARALSGYRLYERAAVKRLAFVRRAQLLGFSLDEIEELLSMQMRPGVTCADIRTKARRKIREY